MQQHEPNTATTHVVDGDLVIIVDNTLSLVSSKSRPGIWHIVRDAKTCTCEWYIFGNHIQHDEHLCRHILAVRGIS